MDNNFIKICEQYKTPLYIKYEFFNVWEKAIIWSINNNKLDCLKELIAQYKEEKSITILLQEQLNNIIFNYDNCNAKDKILFYLLEQKDIVLPEKKDIEEGMSRMIRFNHISLLNGLIKLLPVDFIHNINEKLFNFAINEKNIDYLIKLIEKDTKNKKIVKAKFQETHIVDKKHINFIGKEEIIYNINLLDTAVKANNKEIFIRVYEHFYGNLEDIDEKTLRKLTAYSIDENAYHILKFLLSYSHNPIYTSKEFNDSSFYDDWNTKYYYFKYNYDLRKTTETLQVLKDNNLYSLTLVKTLLKSAIEYNKKEDFFIILNQVGISEPNLKDLLVLLLKKQDMSWNKELAQQIQDVSNIILRFIRNNSLEFSLYGEELIKNFLNQEDLINMKNDRNCSKKVRTWFENIYLKKELSKQDETNLISKRKI